MPRDIAGKKISRVKVVDDDERARDGMALEIVDADLEPVKELGPLKDLVAFVSKTKGEVDAAVCDHRIQGNYAGFRGSEAVAELYKAKFPALLCTRYSTADVDEMRRYRRYIPALLSLDEVNPDAIIRGLEMCILDLAGKPVSTRRPWKTLLRVEDVDRALVPPLFYVAIPGWDSKEIVRLPLDLIPKQHSPKITAGFRFYAQVNKGAEKHEDLYFFDFELD